MAIVRSQVSMPWTTGLSEDLCVNTFHFLTASDPASSGQLDSIDTQLQAFYNTSSGVAGDNISGFMSNLVSRAAGAATIKHYDLDDPEPRSPLRTTTWTVAAADAASSGPTEMALALSFKAQPTSGIPAARLRGRVFVGPFVASQFGTDGRPTGALVASVAAAGNFLHDSLNLGVGEVIWGVYSPTLRGSGPALNGFNAVNTGYCDNEWDVLRSRGRRSTSRTTFS